MIQGLLKEKRTEFFAEDAEDGMFMYRQLTSRIFIVAETLHTALRFGDRYGVIRQKHYLDG